MAKKKQKYVPARAKMQRVTKRLFDAAKNEEYWSSWSRVATTIDKAVHDDWFNLVARSREQYANNDYVKRFVTLSQTNIVGEHGISVQSVVRDRRDQPDMPVQKVIEREWKKFSQQVTTSGLSRADFESLVIQSCAIDGECFITTNVSKKYKYGLAFDFIDPLLCPVQFHDSDRNIVNGIEYSSDGSPVAYYFSNKPLKPLSYTPPPSYWDGTMRLPADQVMHVYKPEWVGQKRGIPWTATALGSLRNLNGYIEAAIINARNGASKMGFFETTGSGEYTGEQDDYGNLIMQAEPGSFEVLPEGLKLSSWNPDYPHQQFGDFVNAHLHGIAVGFGIAHHSLTGDMSQVNYTQGRAALLDERANWKVKQEWLINRVTRPMFEKFVVTAIDLGKLTFNGNPMREQPEYYIDATFQGRRWQWVDPTKDLGAYQLAIDMGVKSRSDIIREQGQDPDAVWEEISKERQILDTLGVTVNNMTNSATEQSNDSNN